MPQTRRILACDGGGIRGIITLRCLKKLEERVGVPLQEYFDLFAGTSTGAVIAGALAADKSVEWLIDTYTKRRREIYTPRLFGFLHPLVTKYKKEPMHEFLRETCEDFTLAQLPHDLLITAVDTVRSETTYFSSFKLPGGGRYGTYKDVKLRDAIEASASAPTYFRAHGRFIDGGSTVYINPAYVAAVEALRYSSDKSANPPQPSRYDNARIEVYSFSTGAFARRMQPGQAMKTCALGWLGYLIEESSSQAGEQHSYVAQSELDMAEGAIVFYRYDLYLTPETIEWARPGCKLKPDDLTLDAVEDEAFGLLDELGRKYARRLFPWLWNPPATTFPAARASDAARSAAIAIRKDAAGHWDQYGKPTLPANYVQDVLDEFDRLD